MAKHIMQWYALRDFKITLLLKIIYNLLQSSYKVLTKLPVASVAVTLAFATGGTHTLKARKV
jgi:hypothetical protein